MKPFVTATLLLCLIVVSYGASYYLDDDMNDYFSATRFRRAMVQFSMLSLRIQFTQQAKRRISPPGMRPIDVSLRSSGNLLRDYFLATRYK